MKIQKFVFDGHPQSYHLAALLLAMLSMSIAFTATIFAEDGTSGMNTVSSSTATSTITSCSYSYSDWSACQTDGKKYRTVTGTSPSGCSQTNEPDIVDSCTYTAPTCSYFYSDWSPCQSNNKQVRTVTGVSPSGCSTSGTNPVLERSCTYIAPTTTTTTTTTSSCMYSYSDWGACQSTGKHYRTVTGMSPSGCVQTTSPKTEESCTYNSTSTTSGSTTADQCIYTYSSWGLCQTDNKRKRSLLSKSPSGCAEYTPPVTEQACVYDSTFISTTTTGTSNTTTSTTSSITSSTSSDATTPSFSFSNISDGTVLKGTVSIRGNVTGATSVEYYLIPTGSNIYKYIGAAQKESTNSWTLSFKSEDFPNGEFYLRVKIKNQYGEYGNGQRKIKIENGDSSGASVDSLKVEEEQVKQAELTEIIKELNIADTSSENSSVDEQKKTIFSYCESNPAQCLPERDSDHDGLSDIDEVRFGTNPRSADSDLDGFIDGDEVKNGFNPVKFSSGDKSDRIVFESPKASGTVKENYQVKDVTLKTTEGNKQKLLLSGKGLPNSFVTIYIYSDPIVLTIKTDADGNWTYELDKELEDGEHEAYVAVTDNTGRITGKSEPIAFVKTAQAVTVIPAQAASAAPQSVTETRTNRDLFFILTIIIAAIAIALAIIGLIKHRQIKEGITYTN